MPNALIITEKPDQARRVQAAVGSSYGQILPALGHLLQLLEPGDVNPAWQKWTDDLLIPPTGRYGLKPIDKSRSFLDKIAQALKGCQLVYIATDADREGQLIGDSILDYCSYRGPVKRVIYVALDSKSIADAFANADDNSKFQGLYEAAVARQQADQIYNLTLTRVATRAFVAPGERGVIGIGRVKTPTLALVCVRELAIQNFKPQDYYEIVATADGQAGSIALRHSPEEAFRILDRALADKIGATAIGFSGPLKLKTERKTMAPPLPLDLAAAQKAAGKWNWTATHTLDVLQKLYEAQLVTYPRAESRHLPENMVGDVPKLLAALAQSQSYASIIPNPPVIRKGKGKDKVFSDKALEGLSHYAIIPNVNSPIPFDQVPQKTDPDGAKLFDIIARAYLCAVSEDETYEVTTAELSIPMPVLDPDPKLFSASTRATIDPGWRRVMPVGQKQPFPPFKNGDTVTVSDTKIESKTTVAPKRYSDSSLIADMENAWKFITDPDERAKLKDAKGIGRPSTRNQIIDGLIQQALVYRKGNALGATNRGLELHAILTTTAASLTDPGTTARMEQALDEIVTGHRGADDVISSIASIAGDLIPVLAQAGHNQKLSQATVSSGTRRKASSNFSPKKKAPSKSGSRQSPGQRQTKVFKMNGPIVLNTAGPNYNSKKPARPNAASSPATSNSSAAGKTFFNVSFADKDDAKALGLRWDPNSKKWYAPDDTTSQRASARFHQV